LCKYCFLKFSGRVGQNCLKNVAGLPSTLAFVIRWRRQQTGCVKMFSNNMHDPPMPVFAEGSSSTNLNIDKKFYMRMQRAVRERSCTGQDPHQRSTCIDKRRSRSQRPVLAADARKIGINPRPVFRRLALFKGNNRSPTYTNIPWVPIRCIHYTTKLPPMSSTPIIPTG
jgi:hypothetical protein